MSKSEEPTRKKRLGERDRAFDAYEDAWYRALKAKAEQRFGERNVDKTEPARSTDTSTEDEPAEEIPPSDTSD